jgi:thiamine pyrophosphate-dependent acetolactate synthase large subunit-like protein
MTRAEAVGRVADRVPQSALTVACNGMIGRELYTHRDLAGQFYMIGSMGLASSIALGLAIARPERTVVVFDGDGNVLMGLGGLASVAAEAPANFYHVIFDNASHGSTGGQPTITDRVAIEDIALAAGYHHVERVAGPDDRDELDRAVAALFSEPGPAMLLIEVERGNQPQIGRVDIPPAELTARFRAAAR